MRRVILSLPIIFFLVAFFSQHQAYAATVCYGGGQTQPGRGGAVGDRCISGPGDECCKIPDGDATQSLICDGSVGSPTQNTCIYASGTGQEGWVCKEDNHCDKNKSLKCVNGKCAKAACSHVNGVCGGVTSCCANENLFCSTAPGGAAGTCVVNTACKKANESCSKNTDCCQGQHLSCDAKTKKCVSVCLTKGELCSSETPGQPGSCCDDQGLSCDVMHLLDQSKPTCVAKTDLNKAKGIKPTKVIPLPPSPPCTQYNPNGGCDAITTAFGAMKTDPAGFITAGFGVLFAMVGGIGLLLFMRAGYRLMTSQGKPEAIQQGREEFVAVLVGLMFLIFSFVLLELIGVDILKIPGMS